MLLLFVDGVKHWKLTALSDHYRNDTMFKVEDEPHGAEALEKFIGTSFGK